MASSYDTLKALREALRISPDNLPLRQHLADTLLSLGQLEDAEKEYRQALLISPLQVKLKLGLAKTFFHLGKYSQSLVITEDMLAGVDCPPGAYLLHARLLINSGAVHQAASQYRTAISLDSSLADADFASLLGIKHETIAPNDEETRVPSEQKDIPDPNDGKLERSQISFSDVGGMDAVKEEIRLKIIYPQKQRKLYQVYGKSSGGGILMYGPPGCGKTFLARATAGEMNANLLVVGINDVLDMWLGNSDRSLHQIFRQARQNKPCVLFFDEVDALAANRTGNYSNTRHVINQFLLELDGIQSQNEGVLILAATNVPWQLDSAFRRPGRFDRIIFIPPPDAEARTEILRLLCRDKPTQDVDYELVGKKTELFSGADLSALVELAVDFKIAGAVKNGVVKPITTQDLVVVASRMKPSTKEWFATARNYALYANDGGLYDDILKYLRLD